MKRLRLRPSWKNWAVVSQKTDFQHQGSSILIRIFGITSLWRSHTNILQQILFRRIIVDFGGGYFRIVEKRIQKYCEKVQICKEFKITDWFTFLGFSYTVCFLGKLENFCKSLEKFPEIKFCFSHVGKRVFLENRSPLVRKTQRSVEKEPCFLQLKTKMMWTIF